MRISHLIEAGTASGALPPVLRSPAGSGDNDLERIEQEVFTRSLRFPAWLSAWLVRVDAHELHHMYPFVPGYRLSAIDYPTENEIGWWRWVRGAKRLPGEVFLFQNRDETGADI